MSNQTYAPTPSGPRFPGRAWDRATPEATGLDPDLLRKALAAVEEFSLEEGIRRTLVIHRGFCVHEGPDLDQVQPIWSCTKSFLSTCFGLLWDDRKCTPHDRVADILPRLAALYPEVTLEQIATFTSGLQVQPHTLEVSEPLHAPGAFLHYSPQTDILAEALTKLAGESLEDLFFRRVGDPIGIDRDAFSWRHVDPLANPPVNGGSGFPNSGIHTNPWNLARFGWLFANEGVWREHRLVSERYVRYATSVRAPKVPPFAPHEWYTLLPGNYGFNWWTTAPPEDPDAIWPHAPAGTFACQGNLNNMCLIVPAWDLVFLRMGLDGVVDNRLYDRVFEILGRNR